MLTLLLLLLLLLLLILFDMFITVLTLIRMKARKAKGEKPLFTLTGGHFCLADRMTRMASTASAASVKVT